MAHRVNRVFKVQKETKVTRVILAPLDLKANKALRENRVFKVSKETKARKEIRATKVTRAILVTLAHGESKVFKVPKVTPAQQEQMVLMVLMAILRSMVLTIGRRQT